MLSKRKHMFFYLIIQILNLSGYLLINNFGYPSKYIYILSSLICISYVFSFTYLIKIRGSLSLLTIFWICLGVFGISRLFLHVLGIANFMNEEFSILGTFYWEYDTAVLVLNYYLIFMLIFSNIAVLSNIEKQRVTRDLSASSYLAKKSNPLLSIRNFIYAGFFASAPILAVYYLIKAVAVSQLGYTSIFTHEVSRQLSFGPLFTISRLVFTVAFYSICSIERREKQFNISSIIYLAVVAIPLIQGSRAVFIASLLTILFLRYRIFGKKIHSHWIFFGVLVGIPFLVMIVYTRNNIQMTPMSILTSYEKFILELSSIFNVPAYYLQHKTELSDNKYPYIFETIMRGYQYIFYNYAFSMGQSVDMIQIRYNLGHQITYNISPGLYLAGGNVASNFIAEMSEFGFVGVGFFSVIVSKLIIFVEEKIISRNAFYSFMSLEFCRWIFLMPRAETFYDTYNLMKYGIIFILIYGVATMANGIIKKGRSNYEL